MNESKKVPRPSYESDPERLRARLAILLATPESPGREALIAHLRRCLLRAQRQPRLYVDFPICDCRSYPHAEACTRRKAIVESAKP